MLARGRVCYVRSWEEANTWGNYVLHSVCMLAMAHGSNEINVAAPLAAQLFLLDAHV